MKTSIMTDLAISMATGTSVLGRWAVPQALPVTVMTAESGKGAFQKLGHHRRSQAWLYCL